jgi:hypothetical protein
VVSYQHSLELNPKNNHAADRLKSFSPTSTQ